MSSCPIFSSFFAIFSPGFVSPSRHHIPTPCPPPPPPSPPLPLIRPPVPRAFRRPHSSHSLWLDRLFPPPWPALLESADPHPNHGIRFRQKPALASTDTTPPGPRILNIQAETNPLDQPSQAFPRPATPVILSSRSDRHRFVPSLPASISSPDPRISATQSQSTGPGTWPSFTASF